ncbi:MAG: copper homeostasis protein CutC [Propionibacteriaceae bacterium]|jgi:copper homeostasis protein|nr:copper homeostasis protein CutC [Propionibacteriaceae bacterium]
MIIREFCAENFTEIPAAVAAGANRIELCDNLAVGGTTPSLGVMRVATRFAQSAQTPLLVMIRPRGGGFVYDDVELEIMGNDILAAAEFGVDGVVLGALTVDGWIDEAAMKWLMGICQTATRSGTDAMVGPQRLDVTFHMAYDHVRAPRQFEALDLLIELGVDRVLTHGSPDRRPIADNMEHVRRIVEYAGGRIGVVVGGGVTSENLAEVVAATGAIEVHGTRIVATRPG